MEMEGMVLIGLISLGETDPPPDYPLFNDVILDMVLSRVSKFCSRYFA